MKKRIVFAIVFFMLTGIASRAEDQSNGERKMLWEKDGWTEYIEKDGKVIEKRKHDMSGNFIYAIDCLKEKCEETFLDAKEKQAAAMHRKIPKDPSGKKEKKTSDTGYAFTENSWVIDPRNVPGSGDSCETDSDCAAGAHCFQYSCVSDVEFKGMRFCNTGCDQSCEHCVNGTFRCLSVGGDFSGDRCVECFRDEHCNLGYVCSNYRCASE